MKITTDDVERELVTFYDLPESEKSGFDYVDTEEHSTPRFVKYRGSCYDVGEFIWTGPNEAWGTGAPELASAGWDGYHTDTFFSAVLVRYVPDSDNEVVIMGLALS